MRRTTISLEEDLFRRVKLEASRSGESMKDYLNKLLRRSLTFQKSSKPFKLQWSSIKGTQGPSVSLDDRDRLHDFLDNN